MLSSKASPYGVNGCRSATGQPEGSAAGGSAHRCSFPQRAHGPVMTVTDRNGGQDIVNFRWRKPVALLVNAGTRSGKEVLTFGFKKYGFGEVIGERTAGALLAARAFLLSDASLMIVAVDDVTVDGDRLEGRGVDPTIRIPFDLPYAAGHSG